VLVVLDKLMPETEAERDFDDDGESFPDDAQDPH
jgi:hypothetical protein